MYEGTQVFSQSSNDISKLHIETNLLHTPDIEKSLMNSLLLFHIRQVPNLNLDPEANYF
jgi:hypothetical protein